ncbi:MAG: iron(III) transport system substrate-binding protein [Alphaproteobacteria bacterium]|jgi:iron(III) transport system substrate-binding protein|nr:iron(III) transport system substrate-binding protein [Alphaproteobacteria bacterium]
MFSKRTHVRCGRTAFAAVVAAVVCCSSFARALTTEEILNYQGADRQKLLEDGARKEGTVVVYSGMIVNQLLRPLTEAFEKKYPFIKTRYWRGDSNQLVLKVLAEMQANSLMADVVEGSGISGVVAGSRIVLPFHSPLFEALPAEDVAADRTWAATRFRYIGVGYNTKYIAKDEAPKNYDDLLDPKWKGKMAWHVGSDASGALITITTLLKTWGEQKTEAYLVKLAKQDITPLLVSNRQIVDQVILGEYWIGLGISAHHPIISATRGAPSATILFDPIPTLIDCIQVLKAAKHPHAAMLFVDFILSTQAQQMMQAAEYFPSNPAVDPAPSLKMIVPKNAGIAALTLSSEQLEEITPKSVAIYKKYFR